MNNLVYEIECATTDVTDWGYGVPSQHTLIDLAQDKVCYD